MFHREGAVAAACYADINDDESRERFNLPASAGTLLFGRPGGSSFETTCVHVRTPGFLRFQEQWKLELYLYHFVNHGSLNLYLWEERPSRILSPMCSEITR